MENVIRFHKKLNRKEYDIANSALLILVTACNKLRKDGITREYEHPLWVAEYLYDLGENEEIVTAALLHDLLEDYPECTSIFYSEIPPEIRQLVSMLTKQKEQSISDYYKRIKFNVNASAIKGADRLHNILTMVGVFSIDKMKSYIQETEEYVLPMLKYWHSSELCKKEYLEITQILINLNYFLTNPTSQPKSEEKPVESPMPA